MKWKDESRETNRMTRCRQLKELVDRLLLGAKTVEDTKNILMTSLYGIGLTTAETNLMNATKLSNYEDLSNFALNLTSLAATAAECESVRRKEDRTRVKCYKCERFGHKSYECRVKQYESSGLSETYPKPIVCYKCD